MAIAVERVLQQRREQRERERTARIQSAINTVNALVEDERDNVIEALVQSVGTKSATAPGRVQPGAAPRAKPLARKPVPSAGATFADKAEAFVRENSEGVSTAKVADAIGQSKVNTYGTLRFLTKSRGTIAGRRGKWFPAHAAPKVQQGVTIRAAIMRVLRDGKARGAADVHRAVCSFRPNTKKTSICSELLRLRQAEFLVARGNTAHGVLYGLPDNGGGAQPAS
jgi:hypothetical protein